MSFKISVGIHRASFLPFAGSDEDGWFDPDQTERGAAWLDKLTDKERTAVSPLQLGSKEYRRLKRRARTSAAVEQCAEHEAQARTLEEEREEESLPAQSLHLNALADAVVERPPLHGVNQAEERSHTHLILESLTDGPEADPSNTAAVMQDLAGSMVKIVAGAGAGQQSVIAKVDRKRVFLLQHNTRVFFSCVFFGNRRLFCGIVIVWLMPRLICLDDA